MKLVAQERELSDMMPNQPGLIKKKIFHANVKPIQTPIS
jgi:hypothetical protein